MSDQTKKISVVHGSLNRTSENECRDKTDGATRLQEKIKELEDELAKKTEEFSQLEVSFQGKCASQ